MMAAKAKGGQEPFEPTDEQRDLVAILAGNGVPQPVICRFITWPQMTREAGKPITDRTLRKAFRSELDAGMDVANAKLIKTAFKVATVDEVPSVLIFLLKTRLGWKEPAQDVTLHMTYGELVEKAEKQAADERAAKLTVITGGKAA